MGDRKRLWKFMQNVLKYSLENGGVIVYRISVHLVYVLTDPDDCLVLANTCLDKPYLYDFTEDIGRNGLITAKLSKWKTHRKLLNPSFNQQVLNTYVTEINEQARNLVSQLAPKVGKDPFDVRKNLVIFTLNIVSRTSLRLNAQDQTLVDIDYVNAFEDLLKVYLERARKVWFHLPYLFNLSSLKEKQDKLTKILKDVLKPLIQKRKLELKINKQSRNDNEKISGKFEPLLERMLHLAEEQDAFTDDEISDHLDTLVIAAFDTTSVTLKLALLVIGSYRNVQDRIVNELQEVLDHDKDGDISTNDLSKLVYLEAAIKETMRLYPTIPWIARKLHTDVKLSMWKFMQNVLKYSLENGGVIVCRISVHLVYVLTDPDDSLVLANACLDKPYFYDFAEDLCRNGLVTAKSSTWKTHRKLINPAFNQQVLNTYVTEINEQARNLVSQLAPKVGKDPFDVRKDLVIFTLNIVSRTSLRLNAQDQTLIDIDYVKAVEDLLEVCLERARKVWFHLPYLFNLSSLKKKQDKLTKILKDVLKPLIQKRKLELKINKQSRNDNEKILGKFEPLLERMLHLAEEQDAFTDDEISDHLDTLVIAAFDTTSVTLKLALLVIGSYRNVQDRVVNELQEVLDHDKDGDISTNDLSKLVYLEAAIKETMRLYPTVPWIARKLHTDVKLKDYTLRAGNTCVIGLYGLSRHPMWGADVEQFKPERWLDPATLPENPNTFSPFGVGKRNCIGKQYAMMVMKTALAHILRRYHVSSDISNLESRYEIVLQPVEGHLISLKLRT